MKVHFPLLHLLVQVYLLYVLMSSQTSTASEKPRVVHWPFINLMQRIFEHIVFTNAVSWKRKFIEVIYQMSNMQVRAIVLSLVTVVWKPQLNATVELKIAVENMCSGPTISLHFYRKKILDGEYVKVSQSQWSSYL